MVNNTPCAECCGPFRCFTLRTALFCQAYWTSRVPRAPRTAGAAGHNLQPSSRSDVVAYSTSMQPGGPQSACHMDPQRRATYTGGNLLDLTEPAAASPRFWADSAGRHAGDGHCTAGGSVDRSGSGSTWRGAPHQQQEHRLLAWLGNSGGTRGVKES